MSVALLDLDDAFDAQPGFVKHVMTKGSTRLNLQDLGPSLRLWSRPKALGRLAEHIKQGLAHGPALIFMGSGDFHHVSTLLIERAIDLAPERCLTVLHFDNHPDWVRFSPGLHCGSWAARVARLKGVRQVLTIGLCSSDIDDDGRKGADLSVVREGRLVPFPLRAGTKKERVIAGRPVPSIEALGDALFLERIHDLAGTDDLYITIDKDVLSALDAATNWDQGELRLERLLSWIEVLCEGRRLRGADITGDGSRPLYGPTPLSTLSKWIEARLDQPGWVPFTDTQNARNATTNTALHNCLRPLIQSYKS